MLLDFLRPHMDVSDNEAFSVYPGKTNNPGDIIKGPTFRRLNVTRKIVIKDVPDLLKSALNMQKFALGQKCIRQCRGSPMGSPLSPALCLMVVSISEQIWSISFKQILSNHHLFIRHIRYVGNRLIFGDSRLRGLPPYEVLLDEGFYGKPIILETEPDQEFLGFMLETKPLELIYQGPTNISQVLLPFSASPPKVLLSGFRSRCHIVVKGAFPDFRVRQALDQLIHLYTLAGFPNEELHTISSQILTQHQNLQTHEQKFPAVFVWPLSFYLGFWFWFLSLHFLFHLVLLWFPVWLKLVSPFASLCVPLHHGAPKVVNFIIILLVPLCTWTALRDSFPSLNRPLNGTIQPWNLSHGPGVQIPPRGTFTRLFLFLLLPPRPQWHLMVAFPPIWFRTLNQIYVPCPLPVVHAMMTVIQPLSPHFAILPPNIVTHHLQFHKFPGTWHLASDDSCVYNCCSSSIKTTLQ